MSIYVLIPLLLASFFLPQLMALSATLAARKKMTHHGAFIVGAIVFILLASVHASLATYSIEVLPNWWGDEGGVYVLYFPAFFAGVVSLVYAGIED